MKISELIDQLQYVLKIQGDIEVMTSSNYGDYYNTEQLNYIEDIQTVVPVDSAYSGTGLAYPDFEEEDEDMEEPVFETKESICVLRYTR